MTKNKHTIIRFNGSIPATVGVCMGGLPQRSFTCFCNELYYCSNYKDFNTLAPA